MTPNELLAFQQGLISAAVIAAKTHDQPGIATEILIAGGIRTMKKLKECGADDFDIAALGECVTPDAKGCGDE